MAAKPDFSEIFQISDGDKGLFSRARTFSANPRKVRLGIAFSIEAVILVAVGGRGTLIGAVLGTLLVMLGKTYVNNELKQGWPIILGGLFIFVVVFLPDGIVGFLRHLLARAGKLLTRNRTFTAPAR